jgi:hypothetical protein
VDQGVTALIEGFEEKEMKFLIHYFIGADGPMVIYDHAGKEPACNISIWMVPGSEG